MVFKQNRFLTLMLALGVIGAAWALSQRYKVETNNRAVEIAIDYAETVKLAGASGLTVEETLMRLKKAGASSLAVQETTVADLAASGSVQIGRPGQYDSQTVILGLSHKMIDALSSTGLDIEMINPGGASGTAAIVRTKAQPDYVLSLPVGLPEQAVSAASTVGMPVVARLISYPDQDKDDIERSAALLAQNGIRKVIFAGDEVLGFRGGIDEVAEVFKKHNIIYGSVEFARQKGDGRLSAKMLPNMIRVHSITAAEMGGLDQPTAVERFEKAAKERNIRLIYVRMFDFGDPDSLEKNADYITSIASNLESEGMGAKPARIFDDPSVPIPAVILMAVGAAGGAILLILSLVRLKASLVWFGFAFLAVIFASLAASGIPIGLKLVAFSTAIIFPSLAVLHAASNTPNTPDNKPIRSNLWNAIVRFTGVVIITGAGGLIVAGLLSKLEFMLRIDQFSGVKMAHLIPIVAAAFMLASGIGWGSGTWNEQKERVVSAAKRLAEQPVLFWQAALAFILIGMVGILLARSGNEPGVGVSGLELKIRAMLDTLLVVRPRTKEFLIGHPAMFLGITAALGGRRNLAAVLLVVGTIGEVSLLNTFCHIHTPIAISVLRSIIGAALGLAIGVILLIIFSRPAGDAGHKRASKDSGRKQVGVQK